MSEVRFVPFLADLIQAEEYEAHPDGQLVRVQIQSTAFGVEIHGDAMRVQLLEKALRSLSSEPIEQMLCG